MGATFSNYVLLGLRLLSTVVLTRALFTTFASEDYGFWALLWSVFAYALLLDFGLGTALQKYTSQWRAGHERNYGALLSTALTLYTGMGLLMALGTWTGSTLNERVGEQAFVVLFWTVMSGYTVRLGILLL